MAKRTMVVTLEVVVSDLPDQERAECAEIDNDVLDDEGVPVPIPDLTEYEDVEELAGLLQEGISPDMCREMFAGSGIFVTFESALLIRAEWLTPITGSAPK